MKFALVSKRGEGAVMGGWMGEGERETLGSSFTKLSLCYTNEELGYIWSTGEEGLYWIETWPR